MIFEHSILPSMFSRFRMQLQTPCNTESVVMVLFLAHRLLKRFIATRSIEDLLQLFEIQGEARGRLSG